MMKGILAAVTLLSSISFAVNTYALEDSTKLEPAAKSITSEEPAVKLAPVEVTGHPYVKFKPFEIAGHPYVKFKPLEVAGHPYVKFINSEVA